MKPSIREVAKLAGVSVATVSHVLNKTKNVLPQTEKKVMDAVEILDYQINQVAQNLRRGTSKIIGFIVSDLSNPHFIEIARGVEQVLRSHGYHVLMDDSKEDKAIEIENVKDLLSRSVDGLLVAPTAGDCSYLSSFVPRDFPMAFIDRTPENFAGDTVLSTNTEGAYEAVTHLIKRGHRHIGFIGSRFDSTMEERLEGYKQALQEAGIEFNSGYTQFGEGQPLDIVRLRQGTAYYLMEKLCTETDITAVFTGNNLSSVGAFMYLREKMTPVPEKMAFITYDDSFWLTTATPAITAIAQNPELMGQEMAKMLIRRLSGVKVEEQPYTCTRIPTQLIERGSV